MKIKYALLDSWCERNVTNKEIDFLLHISHYQDERGQIMGIYYRDVCSACNMSIQTFYDVLRSLQKKEIITYTSVNYDYDITILDNDFSYKGSYKEGYVNVSKSVFDSKSFKSLRAKEKMLFLLFMKVTHGAARSYRQGAEEFYKKYMDLLGVTENIFRTYLHSLKKFFSIGRKNGNYYVTYLVSIFKPKRSESETDQFLGHVVKADCRRSKIKEIENEAIKDTIQLVKQYRQEARDQGRDILGIIKDSISDSVQNFKHKILDAKYVHKLVRKKLGLKGALN